MPGRRIPREIRAFLGPCQEPESPAERVVEQCGLAKLMGDAGLTDYDPLVVVMHLVAEESRGLGFSLDAPEGREVWCEALTALQATSELEHNAFLPCRTCDQAFEPVVNDTLLALFLTLEKYHRARDLVALHRCPSCGGCLTAKRTKQYRGDMHTPTPGTVTSDLAWAEALLQHSELSPWDA
jgi:hypothetical protein